MLSLRCLAVASLADDRLWDGQLITIRFISACEHFHFIHAAYTYGTMWYHRLVWSSAHIDSNTITPKLGAAFHCPSTRAPRASRMLPTVRTVIPTENKSLNKCKYDTAVVSTRSLWLVGFVRISTLTTLPCVQMSDFLWPSCPTNLSHFHTES